VISVLFAVGISLFQGYFETAKSRVRKLFKAGYARWYRKYAPHDRKLERLEKEAREAKRGLWSNPHAIPPWEYRKLQRSETKSNFSLYCFKRRQEQLERTY
jgi:hypothetical protein